jgi:hypothetical protein
LPLQNGLLSAGGCFQVLGDVAVLEWEYLKIDLNQHPPRGDELDLLNHVGAEGWELVGITATNIAYLKRRVEEDVVADATNSGPRAKNANGQVGREEPSSAHEVAVKYRDRATGDTWTGRGRMARWLKVKHDAGEDVEKYRV